MAERQAQAVYNLYPCRVWSCRYIQRLNGDIHPELTGGMIATSSPSFMTGPSSPFSGISIYSRLIVTRQLSRTFVLIPPYFLSRVSNNCASGRGAGKDSESFDVYELADAKYSILKWPGGALEDVMTKAYRRLAI